MPSQTEATKTKIPDQTEAQAEAQAKPGKAGRADWPTIIIQSKDPQDASHQPVGVNGKVWLIRRDVPVEVPPEVLGVLRDAVEIRLVRKPTLDPNEHLWEERHLPRFALNIQQSAAAVQ